MPESLGATGISASELQPSSVQDAATARAAVARAIFAFTANPFSVCRAMAGRLPCCGADGPPQRRAAFVSPYHISSVLFVRDFGEVDGIRPRG